jgi:hypothetical protein
MANDPEPLDFDELETQLEVLEGECPSSNLVIYRPVEEQGQFFDHLCQIYLAASQEQRARIRTVVSDKRGILNHLLGHVYQSARQIHSTADRQRLRIGLAAASIENCSSDYRDFLLALAELYVTAEAAGLNPRPEFKAVAAMSSRETPRGGTTPVSSMLARFHTYAVLKERRGRRKRGETDGH